MLNPVNSNNEEKIPNQESEDLEQIDMDLKSLIKKNESLKSGISKLFSEIEKDKPKSNNSNS